MITLRIKRYVQAVLKQSIIKNRLLNYKRRTQLKKLFLLLILAIPVMTGCCCGPCSENKTIPGASSGNFNKDKSNQVSPLDMVEKNARLQRIMQKYVEAQMDPYTSPEELSKLEEEIFKQQEEMMEYSEKFMNSEEFKKLENSGNPAIKKAMQQLKEAKARQEEFTRQHEEIIEQVENQAAGIETTQENQYDNYTPPFEDHDFSGEFGDVNDSFESDINQTYNDF